MEHWNIGIGCYERSEKSGNSRNSGSGRRKSSRQRWITGLRWIAGLGRRKTGISGFAADAIGVTALVLELMQRVDGRRIVFGYGFIHSLLTSLGAAIATWFIVFHVGPRLPNVHTPVNQSR